MRPIDADALKLDLIAKGFFPAIVKRALDNAPTIEAEPVKHGYWEYDEEAARWGFAFICKGEGCGKAHKYKDKFCPNCGCKMDLEGT